jgi:hypothetical protein
VLRTKKESNGIWKDKSKAELVADFEAWDRLTASQPQSSRDKNQAADRERRLGRESGSANSGSEDDVSRPADEKRKDYAAMTLEEKEGPGSVRFGSVRFLIRRVPVPTIRFQNWAPVSQDQREIAWKRKSNGPKTSSPETLPIL